MDIYKDRVTIYEVAKAAGVSLATVSRVINNKSNVTPDTKKRVEETIQRLGYKPNALAQGLATNRTTNIGIIIPDTNYVHIANLLSGMIDIGKIYGYQTTLFVTKHSKDDAKDVIGKLITSHVDGAIVFDDQLSTDEVINISDYNVPLLAIGHDIEGDKQASIQLNFEDSLKKVIASHFETSQEPIQFLHIPNNGILMGNLEKVAKEASPEGKCEILTASDSYHKTYSQFVDYFKTTDHGFFICPRDSLACAIQNAALDIGLKVPEQVQVISIIGTKYSTIARPTISSFELDMYEVGSIAMRMVTKLLKGELDNKKFVFNSSFVLRASTKD